MKKRILVNSLVFCMVLSEINSSSVHVTAKKSKIRLNYKRYTMNVGKKLKLKVKGTKKKVKWSSNRKKIATVSKKGMVRAVKVGTATITAKVAKKKYKCKIVVSGKKKIVTPIYDKQTPVPEKTPTKTPQPSEDPGDIYDYNLVENLDIVKQAMPDGSILIGMKNNIPHTIPRVTYMLEYTTYDGLYDYENLDFCNLRPGETCYYTLAGSSSDKKREELVNPDTVEVTVTKAYYEYEYARDVRDKMRLTVEAAGSDEFADKPDGTLQYTLVNLGNEPIAQYEFVIGFYDKDGTLMKVSGRRSLDKSNQQFTPDISLGSYIEPPYDEKTGTYLPYDSYRILYQNATYKQQLVSGA